MSGDECLICLSAVGTGEGNVWACKANAWHTCCTDCLEYHVDARVGDGMSVITCPIAYHECNHMLGMDEVQAAAPLAAKKLAALIKSQKRVKKRPNGVRRESRSRAIQAYIWKVRNTRKCPKCRMRIQKSGGCDHMTCKCGHEICWRCGGNYSRKSRSGTVRRGCSSDLFPSLSSNWCHCKKYWAARVGFVLGFIPAASIALGVAAVLAVPVGSYYAVTASRDAIANRRQERKRARRAQQRREDRTARARQTRPFRVQRLPQILRTMPPGPERTRLEGVVDAYGAHADPGQLRECVQSQILTSLPLFSKWRKLWI